MSGTQWAPRKYRLPFLEGVGQLKRSWKISTICSLMYCFIQQMPIEWLLCALPESEHDRIENTEQERQHLWSGRHERIAHPSTEKMLPFDETQAWLAPLPRTKFHACKASIAYQQHKEKEESMVLLFFFSPPILQLRYIETQGQCIFIYLENLAQFLKWEFRIAGCKKDFPCTWISSHLPWTSWVNMNGYTGISRCLLGLSSRFLPHLLFTCYSFNFRWPGDGEKGKTSLRWITRNWAVAYATIMTKTSSTRQRVNATCTALCATCKAFWATRPRNSTPCWTSNPMPMSDGHRRGRGSSAETCRRTTMLVGLLIFNRYSIFNFPELIFYIQGWELSELQLQSIVHSWKKRARTCGVGGTKNSWANFQEREGEKGLLRSLKNLA